MKLDLSRLETEPLQFAEKLELSAEVVDPGQLAAPVRVDLEGAVRRLGHCLRVEGRVTVTTALRCGRCLEPVSWTTEEELSVELVERALGEGLEDANGGDEEDLSGEGHEVAYVDHDILDLAELAAEQVLLALPMRVLCREDCVGLCPRCGGNRNLEDGCRCPRETDPRWQALERLTTTPSS